MKACFYEIPEYVSTHAPVKGATLVGGVSGAVVVVSTHAPVKGATCGYN